MKPQLDMMFALYCHGGSKPSKKKDDHHIDSIEVENKDEEDKEDKDVELVEPIDQYMTLFAPESEEDRVISNYRQGAMLTYICKKLCKKCLKNEEKLMAVYYISRYNYF
jgi:tryptophanyl-tRNA synthetase